MADEKLRELERQAAQGDPEAKRRLIRERGRLVQDVPLVEVIKPLMSHTWIRLVNAILKSRAVLRRNQKGRPMAWGRISSSGRDDLTLQDLLAITPAELLQQPNCGPVTVGRAAAVLTDLGIPLPEPWEEAAEEERSRSG